LGFPKFILLPTVSFRRAGHGFRTICFMIEDQWSIYDNKIKGFWLDVFLFQFGRRQRSREVKKGGLSVVAQAYYNYSYSGGGDGDGHGSRLAGTKRGQKAPSPPIAGSDGMCLLS
jgi:hypothetical protein